MSVSRSALFDILAGAGRLGVRDYAIVFYVVESLNLYFLLHVLNIEEENQALRHKLPKICHSNRS